MARKLNDKNILLETLKLSFEQITRIVPKFTAEYTHELEKVIISLPSHKILPSRIREIKFLGKCNLKFRLNADTIAVFYEKLAVEGYTFNYHEKHELQRAFDESDVNLFIQLIDKKNLSRNLMENISNLFSPVSKEETIAKLHEECETPSKLRKEQGERNICSGIIESLFSSFLWSSFPEEILHAYFDVDYSKISYKKFFWDQLLATKSEICNRENALHIIRIASLNIDDNSYNDLRERIASQIQLSYEKLNNHGLLAIIIEPLQFNQARLEWQLAGDLTVFAEKFIQEKLDKSYFKWESIKNTTEQYISTVDSNKAEFHLANDGLTYKDCFVVAESESKEVTFIVLLFQKNQRDETLIPCPTCRSSKVQANSYPTLGVRSWECKNLICPDRSKYNRGKRYSFRAIIMQRAIEDANSKINVNSVRRWNKDVVYNLKLRDALEMLISHYSIFGDVVHIYNWYEDSFIELMGRKVIHSIIPLSNNLYFDKFISSPIFNRFYCEKDISNKNKLINLGDKFFQVYNGDSLVVLKEFADACFDGAVTSPPYYNAREYSTWPNIYCYLYDMYNINKEVFRTLKPGAFYFYNIFDYFDNEMTVVFSAMGQKRMILSAYMINIFRRIGFISMGNIVWDKGDIEGKRGFNAGNFSPYYQAPFNCWEHVLIFQKPCLMPEKKNISKLSHVLQQKPVLKMVKGVNMHGHSAPFPDAIPELLISNLKKDAIVVDPFSGSLTTGRVAEQWGIKSVCIEKKKEYCELGLLMRKNTRASKQYHDFDLHVQEAKISAI